MHKKNARTKLKQDGIGWVDPEILDDKGCPRMITQHGTARSSFETWALDDASGNNRRFLKETVEACLLHQPNDGFNGAYDRTKKIKDRFELVNAWGTYCLGKTSSATFSRNIGGKTSDHLSKLGINFITAQFLHSLLIINRIKN